MFIYTMSGFKYCIWLTPSDRNDEWYSYTNGFEPHVTLFHHLDEHEAADKLEQIRECDVDVSLTGDPAYSSEDGFHSIYYRVQSTEQPEWWPNGAHVSFYYKYTEVTKQEIDALTRKIKKRRTRFSTIKMKRCEGHFLQW